jgi:hypothetical protein
VRPRGWANGRKADGAGTVASVARSLRLVLTKDAPNALIAPAGRLRAALG